MKLSKVIEGFESILIKGNIDSEITGIAYDSRSVDEGYAFVCIKGFKTDGHNYINDAVSKGARVVVVESDVEIPKGITALKVHDTREALALMSAAYYGFPSRSMKLIGVTGTNGKTTTTYLIKSILEQNGYKVSLIGTISNIIDGKAIEAKRTTPESSDLQEMFSQMRDVSTDYCVMEVSSHSLALKRVEGCFFNVGIFTNLTRDHLDFHKTFENYLNAKMKLFKQSAVAAVNLDDNYSNEVLSRITTPVIGYSEEDKGDVKASDVEVNSKYTSFTLRYKGESIKIKLTLPGRFNVYNALAAASACIAEGVHLNVIKQGLENVKSVAGRSEVIDSGRGFTIIIDYAHTPDGLKNILKTIREYAKAKVITVFGCGGDRDKTKRPEMGEIAGKLSDFCFVTSDNPRTEDPEAIINDILPGIKKTSAPYEVVTDRKEAIKRSINKAERGDVVLIAGKGHETYQVLNNRTIHFDEREIINEILNDKL
ncbi:MAG TPA: UDP-N-acetylmuramoyl-L-alanyl-D-glutamate--2,6-diaminopimelate ligase [Clostridiaceae bacterium]|nr:UDP-N-acetylmuramoyl-L-alanyl-D-glutamate--2,6-diaminopimelate ligase [Clostridiaceae bacterium]